MSNTDKNKKQWFYLGRHKGKYKDNVSRDVLAMEFMKRKIKPVNTKTQEKNSSVL